MRLFITTLAIIATTATACFGQQDKSKRPSPPAEAKVTLASGAQVSINYSQPAVKGRTIGKDIAPFGKVWRTGANEATVFETSANLTVNGQALPAGKYGLFTIPGEKEWIFIFNKTWNQWGSMSYKEADDVLRVTVPAQQATEFAERMTFIVTAKGELHLVWANTKLQLQLK